MEKFMVFPYFNKATQVKRIKVFCSRQSVFKEIWEMTDQELIDYRSKYLPFVIGTQTRLAEIDKEIEKRGLSVEPFRSIYGIDRSTATSSHRS